MPARLVKIARGVWKVRWRDGRKHPKTGRYIESSTGALTLDQAHAEKRRLDAEQLKRRELKRALDGRLLTLPTALELWKRTALARGKIRATYALEVETVLTRLFAARRWETTIDVTPAAIDAWLTAKRPGGEVGKGTDKPLQQLKTLLRYAAGTLRQPVDPLVLITQKRHRIKRPPPPLLREHDIDWLLALAQVRGGDEPYWLLDHLATYGCRPVDTCRMLVGDFDPRAGTVTLRDTKNRLTVTHPLLPRHVERYRKLVRGRRREEPLFRSPQGEAWRITKLGQAGQLVDWYTANVSEHLLEPEQWGIYCLKDYAISRMDALGIDDRTKALFTGHKTLGVFERYKATNRHRANDALRRLEDGGSQG